MGSEIKVSTDSVVAHAQNVMFKKRGLAERFSELRERKNALEETWDGQAAETAMQAFEKMRRNTAEVLFKRLETYAKLEINYIAPGYVEVEETNCKLADEFK